MPEQTETTKRTSSSKKVVIEFGDDCNRQIAINALQRRVRGRWSTVTLHSRKEAGYDLGKMQRMPDIPGVRLELDLRTRKCRIFDPLKDSSNEKLCDEIANVMSGALTVGRVNKVNGIDESVQTLDPDTMKTLLIELRRKVYSEPKKAFEIDGTKLPSESEIEAMEGRRLNDPWNQSRRKPRYHDEVEDWEAAVDRRA